MVPWSSLVKTSPFQGENGLGSNPPGITMKARIINKNALRMEGTDFIDHGMIDHEPICVGQIGLTDVSNPIASGSVFLMLEVYLFYKDFKNGN